MSERHNPLYVREKRSLAWHSEIAKRIERDPSLLKVALDNLDSWKKLNGEDATLYAQWRKILSEKTTGEIVDILRSETEEAKVATSSHSISRGTLAERAENDH